MSLTLTEAEIKEITDYQQPSKQLQDLLSRGFYRARIAPRTGQVQLERAHYEAVCRGESTQAARPQVRAPKLRSVA